MKSPKYTLAARLLGIRYDGIQDGCGVVSDTQQFTDLESGTFYVPLDATLSAIRRRRDAKREEFAAAKATTL